MSTTQLEKQDKDCNNALHEQPLEGFKRLDGPWSWIVCGFFTLCHLLAFGCVLTYGILFPSVLDEFKSGRAMAAIPGSLGSAIGLFGPIVGRLCDQLGGQKGMLLGGLCCAFALLVSSFAPAIIVVVMFFGIGHAVGLGFVHFSSVVSVPLYFKRRSFEAITLIAAGTTPGLIVMTPIVQQMNQNFGWRNAMKFMSIFTIVPFVTALIMRRRKNVKPPDQCNNVQSKSVCKYLVDFSALKIRAFVLVALTYAIYSLSQQTPFVHLGKFCDDIGIPSDKSSWLYFTIGISTLISRLLVGKFGKAPCWSLPSILLIGVVLLSVGTFLLPSITEYYGLILYCVGFGVSDGLVNSSVINIVVDCLPATKRGGGVGLLYFLCSISFITGPILSGFIADVSGSYNVAFYMAAGLLLLAVILCLSLRCSCLSSSSHPEEIVENFDFEKVIFIERETVL